MTNYSYFLKTVSWLHAAFPQRTTGTSLRSAPSATPLHPPSPAHLHSLAPACHAEICTRNLPGFADTPPYSRNQNTLSHAPSRTDSPRPPRTDAAPTPPPPRPTRASLGTTTPHVPDGSPPDGAMDIAHAAARRDNCSEPRSPPLLPRQIEVATQLRVRRSEPVQFARPRRIEPRHRYFLSPPTAPHTSPNTNPPPERSNSPASTSQSRGTPTFPLRIRSTTASMWSEHTCRNRHIPAGRLHSPVLRKS